MKPDRYPDSFFEKFTETPISLIPFDPASKKAALDYERKINELLSPFPVRAELFGSTALEITGKGEWEFAIYLDDDHWFPVLVMLINHYNHLCTLMDDFAVIADKVGGTDIEIIPMRGDAAARNRAIMTYWRSNPEAVEDYEQGKLAHAYSKREYQRWKNKHISDIVESL